MVVSQLPIIQGVWMSLDTGNFQKWLGVAGKQHANRQEEL